MTSIPFTESIVESPAATWLESLTASLYCIATQMQGEGRGSTRRPGMEEVAEAMRTAPWTPAEFGRLECHKDFAFGRAWNGVVYATKRVRPIFVEESEELVVVTVYTYYF